MENLTAYLYLLMGLGCVIIYRILKKRWNIQNNNKNNLFKFNNIFILRFIKIIIASSFMGIFFNYLLIYFQNQLSFDQSIKSFYLILSVLLGLLFYLLISYWIKAFKTGDFKLKY